MKFIQAALVSIILLAATASRAQGIPIGGGHIPYNGGRILNNPHVVMVNWTNKATSFQNGWGIYYTLVSLDPLQTVPLGGSFTGRETVHHFMQEFNTPTQTFGQIVMEAPWVIVPHFPWGNLIGDNPAGLGGSNVVRELVWQIQNHRLLDPSSFSGQLVYVVNFPPGVTIANEFGQETCIANCGYHQMATAAQTGLSVDMPYIVIPDLVDVFGACLDMSNGTCGATRDQAAGGVTSHELMETLTDPYGDAWVDRNTGAEIGDQCNAEQLGANSVSYVDMQPVMSTSPAPIQKMNSNLVGGCVDMEIDHFCCTSSGVTPSCRGYPPGVGCPAPSQPKVPSYAMQSMVHITPNTPWNMTVTNSSGCPPTAQSYNLGLVKPSSDSCQTYSGSYTPSVTPENTSFTTGFVKSTACFPPPIFQPLPPIVAECRSGVGQSFCIQVLHRSWINGLCCQGAPPGYTDANGNYCVNDMASLLQ